MKIQFKAALIAGMLFVNLPVSQAQQSMIDTKDLATFNIVIESKSDALFVRALSEECARRYPERAKSWRKTNESYLGHFKDINALIEAQYMKTLGLAVAKSDFDARAAKVLLRPVTNGTNDVNNICNIAMSSQGVVKLIQNYPIDRS